MKKNIFLLLVLSLFCTGSGNVSAENSNSGSGGFSITPFLKDVDLSADQKEESFYLDVENNSSALADVKFSVSDFGSMDESGGASFLDPEAAATNNHGLSQWIKLDVESMTLGVGEKKSVRVTIVSDDNMSPGGHYGAISANIVNVSRGDGSAASVVNLNSKLTSLIFVRKIGGEMYDLRLKKVEKESSLFSLPQKMHLVFENSGNVHVVARGIVSLFDPSGREVSKGIINAESGIILPDSSRTFPIGLSRVSFPIIPGKYRIVTQYRFDGRDDFVADEDSFLFFPPMICGIIFAALLAMVYGARRLCLKIGKSSDLKRR